MEMEYKDPSKKGRWIVLLGVVLAVVAGGAAFFLINNAQQQAGRPASRPTTAVRRRARRSSPASRSRPTDVVLRTDIPLDGTNAEGVVTDPAQLVGRLLAVDVKPGQLLTTNLLASTHGRGAGSRSSTRTRPWPPTPRRGAPCRSPCPTTARSAACSGPGCSSTCS